MGFGTFDLLRIFKPMVMPMLIIGGGLGIVFGFTSSEINILVTIGSFFMLCIGIGLYSIDRAEKKEEAKKKTKKRPRAKRKKGKRCPECTKIVNQARTECQHCGYKFHTFVEGGEP